MFRLLVSGYPGQVTQKLPLAAFINKKGQCLLKYLVTNYVMWLLQDMYMTADFGIVSHLTL
jgi:hypothetical protein